MAVLVEALSVIVRRDALAARYSGGWEGFLRHVPNNSLCSDDDLARVGFMSPFDVDAYTSTLADEGLVFHKEGRAVDFAVVDQFQGPTLPVPWLEFGRVKMGEARGGACWLTGQSRHNIAVPDGWTFERSLSAKTTFVPNEEYGKSQKFLRREGRLDVYLDLRTGKEMFVGRPKIAGENEAAIHTQLERIFYEALKLEPLIRRLKKARDKEGLASLLRRMDGELLAEVLKIVGGSGRELAGAHFVLGLVLRIGDRQKAAELAFRKANKLKPRSINTLRELVRCLSEQDKHNEALSFAREATECVPPDAGAWGNLAMCLIQRGEREEARDAIDFAIALDPQDSKNRYIRDNFDAYFR